MATCFYTKPIFSGSMFVNWFGLTGNGQGIHF